MADIGSDRQGRDHLGEIECATPERMNCYNGMRLPAPVGAVPAMKSQAAFFEQDNGQAVAA